jgi:hypothetical protein
VDLGWPWYPPVDVLPALDVLPLGVLPPLDVLPEQRVRLIDAASLHTMVLVSAGALYAAEQTAAPAGQTMGTQVGFAGSFEMDGVTVMPPDANG